MLVTFALGTAAGDWTLELTGWSPGQAILLPAGLILAVYIAWKLGAGSVLCFWMAYILTRPLGANIGDFLSSDKSEGGLGWGTLVTSLLFLAAIVGIVIYLTLHPIDRIPELSDEEARYADEHPHEVLPHHAHHELPHHERPQHERPQHERDEDEGELEPASE